MTKVFISYGKEDKAIAEDISDMLTKDGYSVVMPEEQIKPGDSIFENIKASLASSSLVVAVITQNNVGSQWVNQELGYAIASGKPTYLLLGNEVTASGLLSGSTSYTRFNEKDPGPAIIGVSNAVKDILPHCK